MLALETVAEIRIDHFRDKVLIKAIMRKRGISRNTVRKAVYEGLEAFGSAGKRHPGRARPRHRRLCLAHAFRRCHSPQAAPLVSFDPEKPQAPSESRNRLPGDHGAPERPALRPHDEGIQHQVSGRRAGGDTADLTEAAPSPTGSPAGHSGDRPQPQSRRQGAEARRRRSTSRR